MIWEKQRQFRAVVKRRNPKSTQGVISTAFAKRNFTMFYTGEK